MSASKQRQALPSGSTWEQTVPKAKKSKPAVELEINHDGEWYAIMLDYELDLAPGRWPIRAPSLSLDEVQTEMWINDNVTLLPSSSWEAALLHSKGLTDRTTMQAFSGGIYRFRPMEGA
jgi:hypothetical protein